MPANNNYADTDLSVYSIEKTPNNRDAELQATRFNFAKFQKKTQKTPKQETKRAAMIIKNIFNLKKGIKIDEKKKVSLFCDSLKWTTAE